MANIQATPTAKDLIEKIKKIRRHQGFECSLTSIAEEAIKNLYIETCNDYNCHSEQDIIRLVNDALDELERPTLVRIQRYLQNRQGIRFADNITLRFILNEYFKSYKIGTNIFYIKKERKNVEQNIN